MRTPRAKDPVAAQARRYLRDTASKTSDRALASFCVLFEPRLQERYVAWLRRSGGDRAEDREATCRADLQQACDAALRVRNILRQRPRSSTYQNYPELVSRCVVETLLRTTPVRTEAWEPGGQQVLRLAARVETAMERDAARERSEDVLARRCILQMHEHLLAECFESRSRARAVRAVRAVRSVRPAGDDAPEVALLALLGRLARDACRRDAAKADDLAGKLYVKISSRAAATVDPCTFSVRAWLKKLIRNAAVDSHRERIRHDRLARNKTMLLPVARLDPEDESREERLHRGLKRFYLELCELSEIPPPGERPPIGVDPKSEEIWRRILFDHLYYLMKSDALAVKYGAVAAARSRRRGPNPIDENPATWKHATRRLPDKPRAAVERAIAARQQRRDGDCHVLCEAASALLEHPSVRLGEELRRRIGSACKEPKEAELRRVISLGLREVKERNDAKNYIEKRLDRMEKKLRETVGAKHGDEIRSMQLRFSRQSVFGRLVAASMSVQNPFVENKPHPPARLVDAAILERDGVPPGLRPRELELFAIELPYRLSKWAARRAGRRSTDEAGAIVAAAIDNYFDGALDAEQYFESAVVAFMSAGASDGELAPSRTRLTLDQVCATCGPEAQKRTIQKLARLAASVRRRYRRAALRRAALANSSVLERLGELSENDLGSVEEVGSRKWSMIPATRQSS